MRNLTEQEVVKVIAWATDMEDQFKRMLTTIVDEMTRRACNNEIKQYIHIKKSMKDLLGTMREVNESK
jgi:hypothetical protein